MRYFLPDEGEDASEARPLKTATRSQPSDPDDFAEECAQYCYEYCDGWEWRWPVNIGVVLDDGSVNIFHVECEFDPRFYASENKSDHNSAE